MRELKKSERYRFPWSKNDNPIGWLEVTDVCNIHCKGCYRQNLEGHFPLERLKEEVLLMKEYRNIDNVSLAGGEPLTHPDIAELIEFINLQGIKPYLLTNGKAVTEERIRDLRKLGLAGIAFHVDMMQNRAGWEGKDEVGLLPLRDQYVDVMASVGGIPTSFGITVYKDNYEQIPELVRWGIKNIKYVQGLTFITYRGALVKPGVRYFVAGREVDVGEEKLGYATTEEPDQYDITSNDVYNIIKRNVPEYEAVAYLGGTERHDSFKWLIGYMLGTEGGGWLGAVGPKAVEFAQAAHHFFKGTYFAYNRSVNIGRYILLAALLDPKIRRINFRYLANPLRLFYKPVYGQSVAIIQAPDVLPDGRVDMCDACPDLTVYQGQLIHSCRMDEWRQYGGYMTQISEEGAGEATAARKKAKCRVAPV
jgi:MoaA/NifB/PqqE/SkfB family radical SAM enzyme